MNILKCLIILVTVFPSGLPAAEPYIAMHHFADTSCGAWIKSGGETGAARIARAQYIYWFRGFVSGYNFAKPDNQVLDTMPNNETLELYVDKFCREYPLQPFTSAAFGLVEELTEKPSPQKK